MSVAHARTRVLLVVLVTAAALFAASEVGAAPADGDSPIVVNTLSGKDDDDCSLEEAIENANEDRAVNDDCAAGSGDDIINITVSDDTTGSTPVTITAPAGGFQITSNVTIQGHADGSTIKGGGGVEIVVTKVGAAGAADTAGATEVTLADLTIAGATGAGVTVTDDSDTAALTDRYDVILENLLVKGNAAEGIKFEKNFDSVRPGLVHVKHSVIEENDLGGVYIKACISDTDYWTSLQVTNSIIRKNESSADLHDRSAGATNHCGNLSIEYSTITENTGAAAAVFASYGAWRDPSDEQSPRAITVTRVYHTTIEGNRIVRPKQRENHGGGVHVAGMEGFVPIGFGPIVDLYHLTITRNEGDQATASGLYAASQARGLIRGLAITGNKLVGNRPGDQATDPLGTQCLLRPPVRDKWPSGNATDSAACRGNKGHAEPGELGPLADNGGVALIGPNGTMGNIKTIAIDASSKLFGKIAGRWCVGKTDARGMRRPQGSNCDVGAYEAEVVRIRGDVWVDDDGDGVQDADEGPLRDVTLNLVNAAGETIRSTKTAGTGYFSFDVTPGIWRVTVSDRGNDILTGYRPTTAPSIALEVRPGSSIAANYDFGYEPLDDAGERTINVNTLAGPREDGRCSLSEAVAAANLNTMVDGCLSGDGDDTIKIRLEGTITAPARGFQLESNVTIQGHADGTTVSDGGGIDIVLTREGTPKTVAATAVKLADLTISGSSGAGVTVNDDSDRAALTDRYNVTLENLLVKDNTDEGIKFLKNFDSLRPGRVHVRDSVIEKNGLGAIYLRACDRRREPHLYGAMMEVTNLSIRDNTSPSNQPSRSAGVTNDCGYFRIDRSTVSNNDGAKAAIWAGAGQEDPTPDADTTPLKAGTTTVVVNTTIEGNTGGGVYVSGKAGFAVWLVISHATITRNRAYQPNASGVHLGPHVREVDVVNTAIRGNVSIDGDGSAVSSQRQCLREEPRRLFDAGGNSSDSCPWGVSDRTTSTMAKLRDNGGTTLIGPNGTEGYIKTVSIDSESGLYGSALPAHCHYSSDARGAPRPGTRGPCDIGAYEVVYGDVTGTIWKDLDGDGSPSRDEQHRFNAVTVKAEDAEGEEWEYAGRTDSRGRFSIRVPLGGFGKVSVTDDGNVLDGFTATGLVSVKRRFEFDDAARRQPFNFGYSSTVRVGGRVWDDADGDSVQDTNESGLAGVTLQIEGGQGSGRHTVTTDPNGDYEKHLAPGTWTVRVLNTDDNGRVIAGRRNTTPNPLTVPVSVASAAGVDFDFGYGPATWVRAINVNTLAREAKEGKCSLSEAVDAANTDTVVDGCVAGQGEDTINISVPGVIYTRTSPPLGGGFFAVAKPREYFRISSSMTIQGNGTTIDATQGPFRSEHVFHIMSASGSDPMTVTLADMAITGAKNAAVLVGHPAIASQDAVTLENLRIQDNEGAGVEYRRAFGTGHSERSVVIRESVIEGNKLGGVYMKACDPSAVQPVALTITKSLIRNNSVQAESASRAGGVTNACGSLRIEDSTIRGNSGPYGGVLAEEGLSRTVDGLSQRSDTATKLVNTTVAGNTAGSGAGGIEVKQSDAYRPTLSVVHGTIAGNVGGSGRPGGISANLSVGLSVSNTVIKSRGADCSRELDEGTDNVGNISSDAECGFSRENVDPGLGPLADNGGGAIGPDESISHIPTMAISVNSELLNGGDKTACEEADARGVSRPQGSRCDVGAFELQVGKVIGAVWHDNDGNGVKGLGDDDLENVRVSLLYAEGDEAGNPVAPDVRAEAGAYTFPDLELEKQYQVKVHALEGYTFTTKDAGDDDAVDSDVDSAGVGAAFSLSVEAPQKRQDAGLYRPASVTGRVWMDADANGVKGDNDPVRPGVAVTLRDLGGSRDPETKPTDRNGVYSFSSLPPGSYRLEFARPAGLAFTSRAVGGDDRSDSDVDPVSGWAMIVLASNDNPTHWDAGLIAAASVTGSVWVDKNANGEKDEGDSGLAEATMKLLSSTGAQVGSDQKTDSGGVFTFSDLRPGSYRIEFVRPDGYKFTSKDVGDNRPESDVGSDSDADPSSGRTALIGLSSGDNPTSWDAGVYQPASIGDLVWVDSDRDGVKDEGEPGLQGVAVRLRRGESELKSVETNEDGAYMLADIVPGAYEVEFTAPEGYKFTLKDVGDDGSDSDADPRSGRTATLTLASGDADVSVDAGLYQPAPPPPPPVPPAPSVTLLKSAAGKAPVRVGGKVSYSFTVANTGNVPLTGVSVSDPKAGEVACPETTLAAEASTTCTAVYTATAADSQAGVVVNRATVTAKAPDGKTATAFDSVTFNLGRAEEEVGRLAGKDRYATAAVISRETFPSGVDVVYAATGVNFPDALAGSAASGGNSPIVLVTRDSIPKATVDELKRLKPKRIIVLGGTGVVSAAVEAALKPYGSVSRQAGPDRYATAASISAKHFDPGAAVAYVATGQDFPDALTGGPAAAQLGGPILLTQKDKLPAATVAELKRLKPKSIMVLGGTGVVSAAVENALAAYTSGKVTRLAGSDRYSTGAAISRAVFKPGVAVVYVATGANFPDALAGGAAGAFRDGPVLLVSKSKIPKATVDELKRLKPLRIMVLGGEAAVSKTVLDSLNAYLPKR